MTKKTRSFRPSPALVISCVALFLTLAGTAFAATVAKNSVRSAQIVDATVRTVDLHDGAVNSAKVADNSLTADDLGTNSVGSDEIAENAVSSPKVADHSLTSADLAPESVRANELGTITQRNASATIKAGATGSVSVNCQTGEQIISGGGQPSVFGVEMTSTRPQGNGWLYQAKNTTATDQTITAFALCLVQ
ncbi:MAG TPA: hypothetical protein VHU86_00040 [Solirubrobacterales bacterium]|jgi:hypothetical protein|nr:hypothetical protein [Solirubrobacterales bacterium]